MRNSICFSTVLTALMLMQSCTSWIVNRKVSSPSPDGRRELVVATVGIKPHLRVTLEGNGSTQTLFVDGAEWYISFLQTYWSPDSKICALYIAYDQALLLAFDAESGKQVDPAKVKPGLSAALIAKYQLNERIAKDPSFDPLKWMRTPEAETAFREATHK